MNWQPGRQNSGYDLLTIVNDPHIPFDFHIIRYKVGARIPPHIDPVKDGRHFRLNIVLKKAKYGGTFVCLAGRNWWKRVHFFRPDIMYHSVTPVLQGTRYVLSIGWKRKLK